MQLAGMVHHVLHLRQHPSGQSEEIIKIPLAIANDETALRHVLKPSRHNGWRYVRPVAYLPRRQATPLSVSYEQFEQQVPCWFRKQIRRKYLRP